MHKCFHCDNNFSTPSSLTRHLGRCKVIKVSQTMSDMRLGRSEDRGEVALRKKSKSRDRGHVEEIDDFDTQTAERVFDRIFVSGFNFKGAFDNQVPVVQALLLDTYSRERLTFLQDKADFEERQRRFETINDAFNQLQTPQLSQSSVTVNTSTATTSNATGGIFGLFNSQNFTTNTSTNI